jgi:hypothetical protein
VAAKQGWLKLVLIGAAGSILAAAVLQFVGWINLPAWWTALRTGVAAAWCWAITSTPIPHWLLVIMSIAVLAWLALFATLFVGLRRDAQRAFDVFGYVTDVFFNMRWRWLWQDNRPYNIVPFCLTCDMQIDPARGGGYASAARVVFPCRRCGTVQHEIGDGATAFEDVQREVALHIQRNVRQQLATEQAQRANLS